MAHFYVGANDIATLPSKIYVGVDDLAVEVKAIYYGVDGLAQKIYPSNHTVYYYIDSSNIVEQELADGEDCIENAPTATLSGYTFVGWREDTTASSSVLSSRTCDDDISLYAVFSATVTATLYNGSTTASTETGTIYYNNGNVTGASITLTENSVSGWTAAGWTTSASGYTATVANGGSVTLTSSATYYSLYTASVTVTYYNNSTTASTTSGNRIANYHSSITYSNPTFNLSEATVSGWTARGWSTTNTGNASITYANATNFTVSSSVTLYSLYSKTVTVSYDGNDATSGSTTSSTGTAYRNASGTVISATITLASNGFTKTDYEFSTWAEGSTSGTQYSAGTSYATSDDVTMYAIWTEASTEDTYLKHFVIDTSATTFNITRR